MSSEEEILVKKIKDAAKIIASTGMMPFPITDTFIEILKFYFDEDDIDFIKAFKVKKSMTMEELKTKLKDLSEEEIKQKAAKLAKKGFMFNQPSSSGVMVYRLLPIVAIGAFEYTFMPNLPDDKEKLEKLKNLAQLYDKLMHELAEAIQERYDSILTMFKQQPPIDRTIPLYTSDQGKTIEIEKEIGAEETILPAQTVEEIINKFDDIAVGNCFCRQYRTMLDEPCQIEDVPMEVCFTFGKSARNVIEQGFGRKVSKEEALEILKETERAGLVHKAFHNKSDIKEIENSICNCCKCCCDTFRLWQMGCTPMINSTNFLSQVNKDLCTGCGICAEKCPPGAMTMVDNLAQVNEEICIGCGICAHFCPEGAIVLKEGMRTVCVPPPRLEK